jgi:hypothetical protein
LLKGLKNLIGPLIENKTIKKVELASSLEFLAKIKSAQTTRNAISIKIIFEYSTTPINNMNFGVLLQFKNKKRICLNLDSLKYLA